MASKNRMTTKIDFSISPQEKRGNSENLELRTT